MKENSIENFLEKQLGRINEWLRYAEAKNGVLLTLSLACTTKFGEYIKEEAFVGIVTTTLSTISILLCLISFFPVVGKKGYVYKSVEIGQLNLLFYKDIAHLSSDEYTKKLIEKYDVESKDIDSYCKDLISEIVTNSLITVRKNGFFKLACLFLSLSITIYLLVILFSHVSIH